MIETACYNSLREIVEGKHFASWHDDFICRYEDEIPGYAKMLKGLRPDHLGEYVSFELSLRKKCLGENTFKSAPGKRAVVGRESGDGGGSHPVDSATEQLAMALSNDGAFLALVRLSLFLSERLQPDENVELQSQVWSAIQVFANKEARLQMNNHLGASTVDLRNAAIILISDLMKTYGAQDE